MCAIVAQSGSGKLARGPTREVEPGDGDTRQVVHRSEGPLELAIAPSIVQSTYVHTRTPRSCIIIIIIDHDKAKDSTIAKQLSPSHEKFSLSHLNFEYSTSSMSMIKRAMILPVIILLVIILSS